MSAFPLSLSQRSDVFVIATLSATAVFAFILLMIGRIDAPLPPSGSAAIGTSAYSSTTPRADQLRLGFQIKYLNQQTVHSWRDSTSPGDWAAPLSGDMILVQPVTPTSSAADKGANSK